MNEVDRLSSVVCLKCVDIKNWPTFSNTQVTKSTKHSQSWQASSVSYIQEKLLSTQIPTVHCRFHNIQPLVSRWIKSPPSYYISFKIHFNIVFSSMPRPSNWYPSFRFAHQNHSCISLPPNTCHIPCPSHFSLISSPEWSLVVSLNLWNFSSYVGRIAQSV